METTLNDPAQLLSLFLEGVLGRSGRKRSRRASRYLRGNKGLVTASGLLAAAGVAWGIYDSLKTGATGATGAAGAAGATGGAGAAGGGSGSGWGTTTAKPPVPVEGRAALGVLQAGPLPPLPVEVLRIVRLAVSAARADGELSAPERALILEHARRAGVEADVDRELDHPQPLAEIVRGVADEAARYDLYTLAFTIVRADETVTGGERIYLAQLAHKLGIDAARAATLESAAASRIDAAPDTDS
jgi:uncharacterized membrane protein YebE (DUF533 family)